MGSKQYLMQKMFSSSKDRSVRIRNCWPSAPLIVRRMIVSPLRAMLNLTCSFLVKFLIRFMTNDGHAWYIQCFLNRLNVYNRDVYVESVTYEIISEQSYLYTNLLKAYAAWYVRLLKAIAREGCVKECWWEILLVDNRISIMNFLKELCFLFCRELFSPKINFRLQSRVGLLVHGSCYYVKGLVMSLFLSNILIMHFVTLARVSSQSSFSIFFTFLPNVLFI